MFMKASNKALLITLLATAALMASNARGEGNPPTPSTISVDDGNGGWKPYVPPAKPPAGPTGISVDDGKGGWKPHVPPAKPPAGPTGISVDDGKGGWKPYVPP